MNQKIKKIITTNYNKKRYFLKTSEVSFPSTFKCQEPVIYFFPGRNVAFIKERNITPHSCFYCTCLNILPYFKEKYGEIRNTITVVFKLKTFQDVRNSFY